jgi:integrase
MLSVCYYMASIWKRTYPKSKSKYWTACWRDRQGKQHRASTKKTNRKEALKVAEEFEEAALGNKTLQQIQETLVRLHEEATGTKVPRYTVAEYLEEWIKGKGISTKPSTLAFYKGATAKFTEFLQDRATKPLLLISKHDVTAFRNHLASKVSAKTANHGLKCIKMLFKSAKRDGVISEDPSEFVDTVRREQGVKKQAFSMDQLRVILRVANEEWRSMIYFGLYTGQRLADIANLTWSNIDKARRELRLATRKTGKVLILPLAAPLLAHIEGLPSPDDPRAPVHPKAYAILQKQGKSNSLSNQFADLLAAAGLREKKSHKKSKDRTLNLRTVEPLSFHSLRRTATTFMHEAGIPQAVVQAMIGHDSAAVHDLYISVGREALQKAAEAIPKL